MRHHNSVFHQLLKHLPWAEFDGRSEEHTSELQSRRYIAYAVFSL